MQTFLPYEDFEASVEALDYRRLGKQRVEARQILKALETGGGWSNHPATKMWAGYTNALKHYSNVCIKEWISRGYNNTMVCLDTVCIVYPWWLGGEIHTTHRAALLHKDPEFYGEYEWTESPELNYNWPVGATKCAIA